MRAREQSASPLVRPLLWSIAITAVALGLVYPLRISAWGYKGHEAIGLVAEHYMTAAAAARASDLLGGASIDSIAGWADDYRRDHHETGPWHYIDIPLADSRIDMARECPNDRCVIAQTEHFLCGSEGPLGLRKRPRLRL
jgi:hypothetical protein